MYCYFIVLVGNWIFLVVLCVDYINLLYITLETLYVYNFTFVVKLLFMSMPLLTNNISNPTKSYIIIFLKQKYFVLLHLLASNVMYFLYVTLP